MSDEPNVKYPAQEAEQQPDTARPGSFLALAHGQEWLDFYHAFDLLVQDHLSRSSDLLQRAMTLPEVADREVAREQAERERALTAQRTRHNTELSNLKAKIDSLHATVTTATRLLTEIVTDLEQLRSEVITATWREDETPASSSGVGQRVAPSDQAVGGENDEATMAGSERTVTDASSEATEGAASGSADESRTALDDDARPSGTTASESPGSEEERRGVRKRPHWLSMPDSPGSSSTEHNPRF